MGQTVTVNYGLIKPNEFENDDIWGGQLNDNADTIDAQMKANANAAASKQPLDGDLTAIAALGITPGLLQKTGANAWAIDTQAYQPLDADLTSISGITGNGLVRRDNTGGGTWTVDPVDYQPLDADLTAIGALAGTSGILRKTAANTWVLDTTGYAALNAANQFIASQETVSTTAAATSLNPTWDTYRNRTVITDADVLGGFMAYGNTIALVKTLFGRIYHKMISAVAGVEATQWIFDTYLAGSRNQGVLRLAAGAMIGNTVLDQGVGTINAEGVYENGLKISSTKETVTASGAAITADPTWAGKIVNINTGIGVGATTITIQPNSSVNIPIKTVFDINWNGGTPSIVFAAGAGVVINSPNGWLFMTTRYSRVRLWQSALNNWYLTGDLKATAAALDVPAQTPA